MAAGSEESHTSAEQWLPQGPVAASEGLDCLSLPPGQDDQMGPVLSPGLPTLQPSPCHPPHLGAACEGGGGSRLTARGPPRWGAVTRVPDTDPRPSLRWPGPLRHPRDPSPQALPSLQVRAPLRTQPGPLCKAARRARRGSGSGRWHRGAGRDAC